jgi:hypothetical protein
VTAVPTGATAAADQLEERRSAPFLTGDSATDNFQEVKFQDRVAGHEEPHLNPTVAAAPTTSTENEPKKRRSNGDVSAMMERYIEMKTKQIEGAKNDFKNVDEFSIKNCIARLNTMEVSREERQKH